MTTREAPRESGRGAHTPGPWELDWQGQDRFAIYTSRSHCVIVGEAYGSGAEGIANAHLIAAAPDLLAALERLAERPYDRLDYETRDAVHAAREVIRAARAQGSSPRTERATTDRENEG